MYVFAEDTFHFGKTIFRFKIVTASCIIVCSLAKEGLVQDRYKTCTIMSNLLFHHNGRFDSTTFARKYNVFTLVNVMEPYCLFHRSPGSRYNRALSIDRYDL